MFRCIIVGSAIALTHGAVHKPSDHVALTVVDGSHKSNETANETATYSSYAHEEMHKVVTRLEKLKDDAAEGGGGSFCTRLVLQLIFGVIYYYAIMKDYPDLKDGADTSAAVALQEKNALSATFEAHPLNCVMAWCCSGPRAAHTFVKTGIMGYWTSLVLMTFLPCCTLFYANAYTDMNEKLGGTPQSPLMALLFSCFCSCCLIAQDAEALDRIAGRPAFVGAAVAEK